AREAAKHAAEEAADAARYERYWTNVAEKPGSLSNPNARAWYLSQEERIPSLLDKTQPLESQARQAFELRNSLRTRARELMSDRDYAAFLERTEPNATWDQIVAKYSSQYSGDELWTKIIESSQRSRQSVNKGIGIK